MPGFGDVRETFSLKSSGALTVGTGKDRFVTDFSGEVVRARAAVGTAPTGANLVLDILKNGTSIYTDTSKRPTILAGVKETADPVETISNDSATDDWTAQDPGSGYTQTHPAKGAETWSDTPDTPGFSAGDVFELQIVQVGSTVAGSDLEVSVEFLSE